MEKIFNSVFLDKPSMAFNNNSNNNNGGSNKNAEATNNKTKCWNAVAFFTSFYQ